MTEQMVPGSRSPVGPLVQRSVSTATMASLVAKSLVFYSCWFEVTPFPDDVFVFHVKADCESVLCCALEDAKLRFARGEGVAP